MWEMVFLWTLRKQVATGKRYAVEDNGDVRYSTIFYLDSSGFS